MNEIDKKLIEIYMFGFSDELRGRTVIWNPNPLLLRAYKLGRFDAIVGDDNHSDYQTIDEILNRIHNKKNSY